MMMIIVIMIKMMTLTTTTTTTIIIMIMMTLMLVIMIILIVMPLKGAVRDLSPSPHCAVNLQHARLSGQGAVVCKTRAIHRTLIASIRQRHYTQTKTRRHKSRGRRSCFPIPPSLCCFPVVRVLGTGVLTRDESTK